MSTYFENSWNVSCTETHLYKSEAEVSLYFWFPIGSQNNMVDNSRYRKVYYSRNINKNLFIRAIRQVRYVARKGETVQKIRIYVGISEGKT
jgi:hypothetical protein